MKSNFGKLLTFLTLVFILSANYVAFAATEKIQSFEAVYTINKDGTVDVDELITYDFGDNRRHGIFRNLDTLYKNKDGDKYIIKIDAFAVYGEKNRLEEYTLDKSSDIWTIKIGDPNKYVSGVKTYIISYRLTGALTYFDDHVELYWSPTGNAWEVPIENTSVKVFLHLPENTSKDFFPDIKALCFTGTTGSTDSHCTSSAFVVPAEALTWDIKSTAVLNSKEGLTFAVSFPKGLVAVLEAEKKAPAEFTREVFIGLILIATIIFLPISIVPLWIFFRWYRDYKLTKNARILSAWFDIPEDLNGNKLTPAQVAVLIEKDVPQAAISATLVHLAQKGFLKIKVDGDDSSWFSSPKVILHKVKDYSTDTSLETFEKTLLDTFFISSSANAVDLSQITPNKGFSKNIDRFKEQVSASLLTNKMFVEDPIKIRNKYSGVAGGSIILSVFVMAVFSFPYIFIATIPIFLAAYFFGIRSALRTPAGVEKYGESISLANFLMSQTDQLEFQAKNQMFFEKMLPYASALGAEKVWVEKFKDINMKAPDWYEGTSYNPIIYGSMFNSLNTSVGKTIRSSTGHSSGFSGGFSGGGGGGRSGGGSW